MLVLPPVTFTLLGGPYIDIYGGSANGGPFGPVSRAIGGYLYALDDNSCVLFQDFFGRPSKCFGVWAVDGATGNYTYYSTAPNSNGNFVQQILNYGGGNFLVLVSGGSSYFVRVANLKLNNASPILLSPSSVPVSNPCSADVPKMYYDAAHKLLGCGFYHVNSQYGSSIYTTTYRVGSDGALSVVGRGFTGSALSAGGGPGAPSDDWDKTSQNSQATSFFSQSNGILGGQFPGLNTLQCVQNAFTVKAGSVTDCATKNGALVTSAISSVFDTGISDAEGTSPCVDFTFGSFAGLWNYNHGAVVSDGILSFLVPYAGAQPWYAPSPSQGVVITKNYIFHQAPSGWDGTSAYGMHYSLYIGSKQAITSGSSATHRGIALVNNARPISLTGKYKA